MRSTYTLLAGAALVLWGAACTNDFGSFEFGSGGAGGEGTMASSSTTTTSSGMGGMMTTSTSTTSGMGGMGGDPGCTSPLMCPGMDTDCQLRSCVNMVCGFEERPVGLNCNDGGGTVCDGMGTCVECVADADCSAITDGACDTNTNTCLPADCMDTLLNGMETDIDCGGGVCNPCINGDDCMLAADCASNLCDANMMCAACTLDTDCAANEWCDAGICAPQGILGDSCTGDNECQSGNCPGDDGVCCDTSCGSTCESCLFADTGSADGTCAPVTAGIDPKNECNVALLSCNGDFCSGTAGACQPAMANSICRPSAGACDPPEVCDGAATSCPADTLAGGGSICNASQGGCDPQEVCDGATPTCPTDEVSLVNTVCRASVTPCDAEEVCDGVADTCPVDDVIADGGTPVLGGCGNYLCDGAVATCPSMCAGNGDCVVPNTCQSMSCMP